MANITRRPENPTQPQQRPQQQQSGRWDPMQVVRDLLRWDPFSEMAMLPTVGERMFAPQFEVKETNDGYLFRADLPGVAEKDLEISVTGNRISVSGKRDEEEQQQGETYYLYERSYGQFSRSFTLPDGADTEHIRADLRDGVLSLMVPKKPEVKPKKIDVRPNQPSGGQQPKA